MQEKVAGEKLAWVLDRGFSEIVRALVILRFNGLPGDHCEYTVDIVKSNSNLD